MARLACATLVGAVLIALPAIADNRPKGKVVRVERTRGCPPSVPVLCFQFQADGSGLCIGPQPKAGDVAVLVDETQVIAEIRIDATTKAMSSCDFVWQTTGAVVRGDVTAGGKRSKQAMGLIDSCVDHQAARRIPDDKVPKPGADTKVEIGIDRDGDGQADIVVAQATCPGVGQECVEFWTRGQTKALERVWSANLRACSP